MPSPRKPPTRLRRSALRGLVIASVAAVALATLAWSTRDSWVAGMLVYAPASGERFPLPAEARERVQVARDGAEVRAWVFDPASPPRGTVLLLHGIRSNKQRLVQGALGYVASGLRAVAVDSRGHGESSGRFLTYGVEEAHDLTALVDELERKQLLVQPLAVVGSSYGAASALLHAARDARVARVVALAPFASLREVVPAYLEWKLGPLARLIPPAVVDELIDGAARRAAFDADDACPRCAAPRVRAEVLLIHSRDDERIPFQHSVAIRAALPRPAELLLVDGVDHVRTGAGPNVAAAISRFLR